MSANWKPQMSDDDCPLIAYKDQVAHKVMMSEYQLREYRRVIHWMLNAMRCGNTRGAINVGQDVLNSCHHPIDLGKRTYGR